MQTSNPLIPGSIDALAGRPAGGQLNDPLTPGLSIERLSSGKCRWLYRRRMPSSKVIVTVRGSLFPDTSIGDARAWAFELNASVMAGVDPRVSERDEGDKPCASLGEEPVSALPSPEVVEDPGEPTMTVRQAHELYMRAAEAGRASKAKRPNKPRTLKDKRDIFSGDIAPTLADRPVHDVTEEELVALVEAKGKCAPVRANRLGSELMVFFGWMASLRGKEVGLPKDPSARLRDLRHPETPRSRKLSLSELGWFLRAVALEPLHFRRGWLLFLLIDARRSELTRAARSRWLMGFGRYQQRGRKTLLNTPSRSVPGAWPLSLRTTPGLSQPIGKMARANGAGRGRATEFLSR